MPCKTVKQLVESVMKPTLEVGKVCKHPDGRTVRIMDGRFWGTHGVSNWWTWREVLADGKLGKLESGYGW